MTDNKQEQQFCQDRLDEAYEDLEAGNHVRAAVVLSALADKLLRLAVDCARCGDGPDSDPVRKAVIASKDGKSGKGQEVVDDLDLEQTIQILERTTLFAHWERIFGQALSQVVRDANLGDIQELRNCTIHHRGSPEDYQANARQLWDFCSGLAQSLFPQIPARTLPGSANSGTCEDPREWEGFCIARLEEARGDLDDPGYGRTVRAALTLATVMEWTLRVLIHRAWESKQEKLENVIRKPRGKKGKSYPGANGKDGIEELSMGQSVGLIRDPNSGFVELLVECGLIAKKASDWFQAHLNYIQKRRDKIVHFREETEYDEDEAERLWQLCVELVVNCGLLSKDQIPVSEPVPNPAKETLPANRKSLLERLKSFNHIEYAYGEDWYEARNLWPWYQVAVGVTGHTELKELEPVRISGSVFDLLDELAAKPSGLPLLRFLLLMVNRDEIEMPPPVREQWVEEVETARQRRDGDGWDLGDADFNDLVKSAKSGSIQPCFQLDFEMVEAETAKSGPGKELAVSGRQCFGWETVPLDLPPNLRLPWSESFDPDSIRKALIPLLEYLDYRKKQWLGDVASKAPSIPRLEVFLRGSQFHWPIERVEVSSKAAGELFQIIRRLHARHYGDAPSESWEELTTEYDDYRSAPPDEGSLPPKAIAVFDSCRDLPKCPGDKVAFVARSEFDPSGLENLEECPLVAGIWVQPDAMEGHLPSSDEMVKALTGPEPEEAVRRMRRGQKSPWNHLSLMIDPFEPDTHLAREQDRARRPLSRRGAHL